MRGSAVTTQSPEWERTNQSAVGRSGSLAPTLISYMTLEKATHALGLGFPICKMGVCDYPYFPKAALSMTGQYTCKTSGTSKLPGKQESLP